MCQPLDVSTPSVHFLFSLNTFVDAVSRSFIMLRMCHGYCQKDAYVLEEMKKFIDFIKKI